MGTLFSYSIISSILLCCGYVVYKWLFSTERQHSYNRLLIYAIYLLALIIPLLLNGLKMYGLSYNGAMGGIEIGYPMAIEANQEPVNAGYMSILTRILLCIYVSGICVMTVYSTVSLFQIQRIIRRGERIEKEGYVLILSANEGLAPFSWKKYIIMSKEEYGRAGEVIMIHERRHLDCRHWIDLLFAQLVLILQWFNPAAWLFREEFKTVHEYQADEAVLNAGTNIKEYQLLLIRKAVGSRFHSHANSLNHSKLKKRVTMMYKEKSSLKRRLGALLLLPTMAIGSLAVQIPAFAGFLNEESEATLFSRSERKISKKTPIAHHQEKAKPAVTVNASIPAPAVVQSLTPSVSSQPEKSEAPSAVKEEINSADKNDADTENKIYTAVQKTAEPDGGMKALIAYLHSHIEYPEEALKEGKEGKVIVRFVIEKNGNVGDAQIVKSVDPVLDQEALRVVKTMPKWTPAKVDGESVASYYVLPVSFSLPKDEEKAE